MVKLQESDGRYFITIPKEYVADKGWKKGQDLLIGFDGTGNLVLKESSIRKGGGE